MQMSFSGIEGRATSGNGRRKIAPHGDRRVEVLLSMPQMNGCANLVEAKSPRSRVEPHFPGGAAASGAKRFAKAFGENFPHDWPVEVLPVDGSRHTFSEDPLRLSRHRPCHASHQDPPQDAEVLHQS